MIYGISDLHLDFTKEKDMKVFGSVWEGYEEQIFENWKKVVKAEDTVLVPGDISWAMHLSEARRDLKRLDELPGTKYILRGNHDYWWESLKKIEQEGYETIRTVQNNAFVVEGTRLVGTRGWDSPDAKGFTEADEKVYQREILRLEMSLNAKLQEPYDRTIAMLHYPPFFKNGRANDLGFLMQEHGVSMCVYGHLHSEGLVWVQEGWIDGVEYRCISADYLGFRPVLLEPKAVLKQADHEEGVTD